jgi:molybdate transport system substrate-binding protein
MPSRLVLQILAAGVLALGTAVPAHAEQTNVAVAANFTDAAQEIAQAFKEKTGHEAILSFGSTGQFYTQITQDAPFEVFLAADDERPRKAIEEGFAVPDSQFTYAIGKLVLWSKDPDLVQGEATLKNGDFTKIAIANPEAALTARPPCRP